MWTRWSSMKPWWSLKELWKTSQQSMFAKTFSLADYIRILLFDNHRAQAGAKMHTFRLLHALHTTDVKEKMERSRDGPMQLELKMEKHRPVLWSVLKCPSNKHTRHNSVMSTPPNHIFINFRNRLLPKFFCCHLSSVSWLCVQFMAHSHSLLWL